MFDNADKLSRTNQISRVYDGQLGLIKYFTMFDLIRGSRIYGILVRTEGFIHVKFGHCEYLRTSNWISYKHNEGYEEISFALSCGSIPTVYGLYHDLSLLIISVSEGVSFSHVNIHFSDNKFIPIYDRLIENVFEVKDTNDILYIINLKKSDQISLQILKYDDIFDKVDNVVKYTYTASGVIILNNKGFLKIVLINCNDNREIYLEGVTNYYLLDSYRLNSPLYILIDDQLWSYNYVITRDDNQSNKHGLKHKNLIITKGALFITFPIESKYDSEISSN